MNNLQQFSTTLEDFDKEVDKLKAVSGAYQKLQNLTETYDGISKQFNKNSEVLETINESQKEYQGNIIQSLLDIENTNSKNQSEILTIFSDKTDLIRKENKEFYREIENTIRIKLDENKSEIKRLIENERNQIKEILQLELLKNTNEVKDSLKKEFDSQTQILLVSQNQLKKTIIIIGGILMILSGLIIFKMFNG